MPTRLLQAKSLLLLAAFLAAGTSLPSLDAVVYHHQGAEAGKSQTHVEAAGGCLDHAEHCVLGRTAPGSGASVTPPGTIRVEPVSRPLRHRLPAFPGRGHLRGAIPQPRAPPGFRDV